MSADRGPPPLRFDAATVIATWFGVGLLPLAPGTWGSLAALPFAWAIAWLFGTRALLVAAAIVFLVGWWAAGRMTRDMGIKDAGAIVVDEVVGQWITLAVAPREMTAYIAGFVLFRIFDVAKPWPAGWADTHLAGGFGVMADDVVAACYAVAGLVLLLLIMGEPIG